MIGRDRGFDAIAKLSSMSAMALPVSPSSGPRGTLINEAVLGTAGPFARVPIWNVTICDDGVVEHSYVETRPWGNYTVLVDAPDHKVKSLTVEPGKRLSYQRHLRRSEHWFVVSGTGFVILDDVETPIGPTSVVDVPVGMAHRIGNTGDGDLTFIEVQYGEYFGEDDIIRLEDDFGRIA